MAEKIVIGIDVGTQGVRVLAVDKFGQILSSAHEAFPRFIKDLPEGWFEQNPTDWWRTTQNCLHSALEQLINTSFPLDNIVAISVDSTSGTIVPIDTSGNPLCPALMYNDSRGEEVIKKVRGAGKDLEEKLGYSIKNNFAIAKIFWLKEHSPKIFDQTYKFIHASDFIVGRISGNYDTTDHSNALKTCFDLLSYQWPDFIEDSLAVPIEKLPSVVSPGSIIGNISPSFARESGLSNETMVIAGCTDGTASQIASGAIDIGSWNSTLGTTLVIKGISKELIKDPLGRFYSHLHPEGMWMPGGASNTGTEWILKEYPDADLAMMDESALDYVPGDIIAYPLARKGERFPFIRPEAQGFLVGKPGNKNAVYAAKLEGLGYLERLIYTTLEDLGASVGDTIYATGGGAKSEIWLEIRASILSRCMKRPKVSDTAMGAAILAASKTIYKNISEASKNMVNEGLTVEPKQVWVEKYNDGYYKFHEICRQYGFI